MKIKVIMLIFAVFALVSVKSVSAQANDTNVVNSGDNVEIESEAQRDVDVDVDNDNEAWIDQKVVAIANTGGNVASRNISSNDGGTSIETGDASVDVKMDVDANKNFTAVDVGNDCCDGNKTDIVNTGDDLDVDTKSETDIEVDVDNDNKAWVDQKVVAVANTGLNFATRNVGGASITTGDANVNTDLKAKVNQNVTKVDVGDDECCPGNETCITNTGDDVEIESEFERDVDIDIDNDNEADIRQDVFAISNTGLNFAKRNISCPDGDGTSIETGDAWVDAKLDVDANKNATIVKLDGDKKDDCCPEDNNDGNDDNDCCPDGCQDNQDCGCDGDFDGDQDNDECCDGNQTDIVNTGDCLDVDVKTEIDEEVDIDNDNELFVDQCLFDLANTGLNFASRNVGDEHETETGDAWTGADLKVTGNKNSTMIGEFEDEFFNEDFFNQFFGWWN